MPAYIVFHNRVLDAEALDAYVPPAVESMAAYGAEIVVLDENSTVIEGTTEYPRTVILKFDSRERAQAWYDSAEYQKVLPARLNATEGYAMIVDGFEPG